METSGRFNRVGLSRGLVEDIAAHLSDAIIEGQMPPGQPIVETDLQRSLGISRAPLREALLKLEGQGLVRIVPRKGAFVRPLTPRLIREMFTMRAWLEGLAARLAAEKHGPALCDSLEAILAEMGSLADEKNFKSYFYRHWGFHWVFIEGSGNGTLMERIAIMRRECLWLSYSITYFEHHHQASQATHRRIIELFRNAGPVEVELAVRTHILDAADGYVRFLKETYPELHGAD
jgi:DNA-binding GntR family transcriptional regulator